MNDPKQKETQQELFPEISGSPKKPDRFGGTPHAQKPILMSTNPEQLLMVGILAILLLCGVFFLGVVRGRSFSRPLLEPAGSGVSVAGVRTQSAPREAAPTRRAPEPRAAAPALSVEAAPAAPGAASKPYTIQLVTHRKKELADKEMAGVRAQGLYSFIIKSGEYFQVCVGQYATKEEAKKDLLRFSARFKDCFLRRR